MPYTKYICPDGGCVDIAECLKKCRIGKQFEAGRCLSHRTLLAISEQREWKGIPSTTQLLNGTREEYLRITQNYALDPQSSAFALFGTGCHSFLQMFYENDKMLAERRLTDPTGTYTGQYDCYDGKRRILYDVKTYGSYKTAAVMGLKKVKSPVMGADGKQERYKNGKKKYKVYWRHENKKMFEVAAQLNAYRLMVENAGYKVDAMLVEIFTRDAGTFAARDRGIFTNMQLVKVQKISNCWIQKYFLTKAKRLTSALAEKKLPPPCSYREKWGGRKCENFCHVWEYCDVGRKAHREEKK